jgi:hypothetical protein
MKIILLTLYFTFSLLYGKDTLVVQQQNVLYVQNLIEIEEKIASNFERYLLTEFKIPNMSDLNGNEYLGSNFTITNKFSSSIDLDISLDSIPNLKIKYGITKDVQLYVLGLYNRDLYRDMTSVYVDTEDSDKSYVSFTLKSKEAENILEILKTRATIKNECTFDLKSTYCITNLNTIRWYDENSNWIEYNNKDFEDGNVTISVSSLLSSAKLDNLKTSAFIFVNDGDKYLKIIDRIVKVD